MNHGPPILGELVPLLAFGIGVQELIVIVLILLLLASPALVAVVVVLLVNKAGKDSSPGAPPNTIATGRSRTERLEELEGLLARSLITEEEYRTQRERILNEL